ncbi:Leucine-responsive regulatory protein [Hartmannibacter diazotrophicus]|uniref:Leucine-responsive regulatory protein n=1 Tax=Hartmannibacter diazotrophicus TaxID=1482074 RepID=A0A2C9DAA0_9HYPH|nr:Lrp/AsnC family transcriptional regulator [Hartmannibacter diazotrophicus]SON57153.1 Leucine-responsive regulatory protein [Hartmannibacter diazotrophicus]
MPQDRIDGTDRKILQHLQEDGRLTNVELAERINLSPSPCLRRVKKLETEGVIRGYRAVVDRKQAGLGLTVFVSLSATHQNREEMLSVSAALAAMPEVVACHMVSGESDFLLEVVVPDLESYEHWMTERLISLDMVENIRSNFAIRTVKDQGPLPV